MTYFQFASSWSRTLRIGRSSEFGKDFSAQLSHSFESFNFSEVIAEFSRNHIDDISIRNVLQIPQLRERYTVRARDFSVLGQLIVYCPHTKARVSRI